MAENIVNDSMDIMLSAGISSVLILVGFILNRCKLYITGGILTVAPSVYLLLYFKAKLTDANGVVGLSPKYYWRHLIPLAIIILAIAFMTVIAVRAKYKLRKQYNRVTENLFNMYNVKLSEDGVITDEQWDEFLKVYDPRADYNKQFAENAANEE